MLVHALKTVLRSLTPAQLRVESLTTVLSAEACEHLRSALKHAGDTHSLEDVVELLNSGEAKLRSTKKSTIVWQEFSYPKAKQLHFWLAGGDLKDIIVRGHEIAEDAKKRGFSKVSIIGRPGWKRRLKGFRQAGVILARDF